MNTYYNEEIPNKLITKYLNYLINNVFALLYAYEKCDSNNLSDEFIIRQNSIIQKINGYTSLLHHEDILVIDLLSYLESLKTITNHTDYRRCIFKIIKIITKIIEEVDSLDGI